jgi:hypothetical protein
MMNIYVFAIALAALILAGCGSAPTQNETPENTTATTFQNESTKNTTVPALQNDPSAEDLPSSSEANTFNGIPVEVIGIPYEYKDICGNHSLDYVMETEYKMISTGQSSSFVNFTIDKFVFTFHENGSLVLSTVYSYDKTPTSNEKFYPAQSGRIHEWKIEPKYHRHSGGECSLDFYNDIAISQAKLNEMRGDGSLGKVYDVLLSVAEDMDYNFPAVGRKAKFVTLANGREPLKGVCDDYSVLLIDRLTAANINGVSNIQKISGQNHAWITLVYKGRTLYLDATWFDKNTIDENGVVNHTPHKDPRDMTFDNEIFTNHGHHHIAGDTRNIGS